MPDFQPYVSVIVAAIVCLCAVIIAILIYKLLNQRVRGRKGQRLGISEFHELDKTRRIVLVRRDDVEHLIMIGGNQDVVIESGIQTGLMAPPMHQQMQVQPQDVMPLRTPQPPVFGSRRPILRPVGQPMQYDDGSEDDGMQR